MRITYLFPHAAFSFLIGIGVHSIWPYIRIPNAWLIGGMSVFLMGIIFFHLQHEIPFAKNIQQIALILFCFMLGLYRFSLVQPYLPPGLVFGNPKGLARSQTITRTANQLDPRHWLSRLRIALRARAETRFAREEAALLTGILYGEKGLSPSTQTAFRHAGLLHIIAVSGSNITILVTIVMRIFLSLRLWRRHAFLGTIVTIVAFTFFVGLGASIVRAAIMGILCELAPVVGRLVQPKRLLLVAAFLFAWWHPWALFFDPSFALSFLAMLGLLTIGQKLETLLAPIISSDVVRETVVSTLSATIMTTPYAAWAFGNVTLWGLVTNLLVLPLIPWAMLWGALSLVVPAFLAAFVSLPALGCLQIMLYVSRIPGRAGVGAFDKAFLSWTALTLIYTTIFLCWYVIKFRNTPKNYPQDEWNEHEC